METQEDIFSNIDTIYSREHSEHVSYYLNIYLLEIHRKNLIPELTPQLIKLMTKAAKFHDNGKALIPPQILHKQGILSPEEFGQIQLHTIFGAERISKTKIKARDIPLYNIAFDMALYHHEKWDGTGYPYHLKEYSIPFVARAIALADVYDALRSRRSYKAPFTHSQTMEMIEKEKGKAFDPHLTDFFLQLQSLLEAAHDELILVSS